MKHLAFLLLFVTSFSAFAVDDYKHMVFFGRNGLGWGGAYEEIDTESQSPFDEVKYNLSDIALNYAYRLGSRWQVGAFYQTGHSEYNFEQKDGAKAFAKVDTTLYGAMALYNFNEDFTRSYYLGAVLSYFTLEEENSHNLTAAENKAGFELDDTGITYELVFGKRFSLEKWEIKHLTYSPNISVFIRTHGRDFNDQAIDDGVGVAFQVIKFDFLF